MSTCCTTDACLVVKAVGVHILYYEFMPISCYFQDCKVLLVTSMTRVSSAIKYEDLDVLCTSLSKRYITLKQNC